MEENRRIEERLERIDGLRGQGGRLVLLAEVRKLLAEADAALAERGDPPPKPPETPPRAA